ncbi:MAG: transposase [Deltaproteobacteria bacterium]|nr:transposase [Deltaproteobacteria bacterium]
MSPLEPALHHRRYDPSLLYLVTLRTCDGRWTLRSDDHDFQKQIVGALAAAQSAANIKVYAFTFMSNHYHGLFSADGPEDFAAFLCHFHAATARLVNKSFGRTGPMWHPRAHVEAVLPGEASELTALRYIVLQAANAGTVAHPRDWTGASSTGWLLDGVPVLGDRIQQTARTLDARNGRPLGPLADYTEQLAVAMTPLPHLAHLGADQQREILRAVVDAELGRIPPSVPENALHLPDEAVTSELDNQVSRVPATEAPELAWQNLRESPPPRRRQRSLCIAPSRAAELEYMATVKEFETSYAAAKARLRQAAQAAAQGDRADFVAFPPFGFAAAGRLYLRISTPQ